MRDEMRWCPHCHKMLPCRFAPSPDAGPHWRCSECGEIVNGEPPAAAPSGAGDEDLK